MLWNLSVRSGLFPFRLWTFAPKVCLHRKNYNVFGVSLDLVRLWAPFTQRVLYPVVVYYTLYLNIFRRKPAISKFDWLFTPIHKSSPPIATDVSSVLQNRLIFFQPVHE